MQLYCADASISGARAVMVLHVQIIIENLGHVHSKIFTVQFPPTSSTSCVNLSYLLIQVPIGWSSQLVFFARPLLTFADQTLYQSFRLL